MSTGTVRRIAPAGHDGFIRPDGGPADGSADVHFSIRGATPPELKIVGTRVEYDSVDRPRGPHTDNARVIADPIAPPTGIPAAAPVAPTQEKLLVSWRHDPPIEQINLVQVKIWIKFLLLLGMPAVDLVIHLFKVDQEGKRTKVTTPSPKATPDATGEAYFALYFAPDVESCDLVAIAEGKEYPHFWEKNKPAQAVPVQPPMPDAPDPTATIAPDQIAPAATEPIEPPKIAQAIQVFNRGLNQEGLTAFLITTRVEDNDAAEAVPSFVLVESSDELELKDLDSKDGDPLTRDNVIRATTNEDGWNLVHIRPAKAAEADVYFRLASNPTTCKGPFKVTRKKEAEPTATIAPTTTGPIEPPKIKRVGHSNNIYTFEISGAPNANIDVKGEAGVEVRDAGGDDASWVKPPFQLGADGKAMKELRVRTGEYGRVRFCDQDKQSDQEFISNS